MIIRKIRGGSLYRTDILKDIDKVDRVYIAGHINPDGDAVSACFAFAMAVKKLGKTPVVLLENIPDKYNFLKGSEFWYTGDYEKLNPQLFVALDCGDKQRLGIAAEVFDKAELTYNIDHHASNVGFADIDIINGTASSACEMVFEVLTAVGVEIDYDMAVALYTGIVFDTGGFKHNSTLKRTHEISGALVEMGVPTSDIHSKLLFEHTLPQVKLLNTALTNMKLEEKIAYSYLTLDEINSCGASFSDLDGITEYLLNITGIEISLLITQREEDFVKLSFRSRGLTINQVAMEFGGGGHKLAAGAGCKGEIKEILEKALISLKSVVENG